MLNEFLFIFKKFAERNPKRNILRIKNTILAPADGKVLYVKLIKDSVTVYKDDKKIKIEEVTKSNKVKIKEGYLIAIHMSPFNVHINQSPIDGVIEKIFYKKGKFFRSSNENSELQNERNCIIIKNRALRLIIIQIAAKFFGKIICNVKEGQKIKMGDVLGMITLGSQVDVLIPKIKNLKIKIRKKNKVYAGVSQLASY